MSRFDMVFLEMYAMIFTMVALVTAMYNIKKRYNKLLVLHSLLLMLTGFILSVIFSSIEKELIAFSRPLLLILLVHSLLVFIVLIRTIILRSKRPGTDAVIQAFDKMSGGIAYCEPDGRVVLCNEVLHGICKEITGTRMLNGNDLVKAVEGKGQLLGDGNSYELELAGKNYYVSVRNITVRESALVELRCDDITTLHQKQELLRQENEKLEEINRRLVEYGQIADSVIKEQEILNAKIRIHDRFGALLLGSKRALETNASEQELNENIQGFIQLISVIDSGDAPKELNYYEELEKVSRQIGVAIHVDGEFPKEDKKKELCCLAIRECVTNTFKHAGGHNLYVSIRKEKGRELVRLTNDGRRPKTAIMLGTGLSSLKAKVEKAGGEFAVSHSPEFNMEIKL